MSGLFLSCYKYVLQFAIAGLCQFWHIMEAVPVKVNELRKLIWLVDTLERLTGFPRMIRHKARFRAVPGPDRAAARERQNLARFR